MSEIMPENGKKTAEKELGLQTTLVNGRCENPIPLLDRLSITRGIWDLCSGDPAQAADLLSTQLPGTFVVIRNEAEDARTLFLQTQESKSDALCHFPIKEDSSAFYLEDSQLRFRNVLELVSFYIVSRDILPCQLRLPDAFQLPCKSQLYAVAALGMKFWTMPLKSGNRLPPAKEEEDPTCSNGGPPEDGQPSCSIRVTSEDKALCIINPLFLSVHSDVSWLDLAPGPCRLASRRGPLQVSNGSTKAASREPGVCQQSQNRPRSLEGEEKALKGDPLTPSASTQRRLLLRSPSWNSSETLPDDLPSSPNTQKDIRSPHRVSWIEGAPANAFPAWPLKKSSSESSLLSDTLSLPLIPELDSLSISSVEDEAEGLPSTPAAVHKRRPCSSAVLSTKVFRRLSAVSLVLGGFLSADRRISKRVQELAQDPSSYVGGLVQSFVGHLLQGGGLRHPTSTEMLQEIRQMISNLKGYLCESSELQVICEHYEAEDMDLGYVVEGTLYKCILKPLRDLVYAQLQDFRSQDGTLDKLRGHQATMREQSLAEMGVASGVPDSAGLERLQTKLSLLHQAYSPRKKETQMLKICKMLYETMNQTPGRTEPFGADDFLPVLIYMLVNCDIVSVQLDVEYMMELMDPSQLQGEGGYYLTTWFGALFHIANFQPAAMITRQISIEAQRSIHQWHRRRTIHPHHHHPIRRHSQNILYISFHEPFNNQKTVSVTAEMTTASVCAICAEKYSISEREAYGLFLVSGESSQLLAEDSYPQRVHSSLLRSKGNPASFVYKPKDGTLPTADRLPVQDPKHLTDPLESGDTEPSADH
nr:ras and Rab interactor-like protein [Anolis sagrei ordinatus]